jgi:uncharacterized membrane protein YbhN (UPF0104 family)
MANAWRRLWPWLRVAAGIAVIAALVRGVGADAFLDGFNALDPATALAALAITALTTACCAWRWRLVVRALGGELGLGAAMGAYYRSQFLDATLPGGILGDVYRGVRRGTRAGNLGRGLRAVFWERVLGQGVQWALTILVLLVLPSPAARAMPAVALAALLALAIGFGVARALRRRPDHQRGRLARAPVELRGLTRGAWLGIAMASTLAVAGFVAIFVLAAHAVGVALPAAALVPIVLLALAAAAIPFNVAGFGPREGVAAWAFAGTGAGAQQGVAAATLYGVLALIAVAPGALWLLGDWLRPARPR